MTCDSLIRIANEGDAEGLAPLYCRSLRDAYENAMPLDFVDPVGEAEHASRLRAGIHGGRTWLLSVSDERIVGCCGLASARDTDLPGDTGEITTLAVERAHRRHGHGRDLLDAARRESVRRGWRLLVLWVVTGNDGARAFYARAGFEPDGLERTDERLGFPAQVLRYRSATAP